MRNRRNNFSPITKIDLDISIIGPSIYDGQNQNRSTAGSYQWLTGPITLKVNFLLHRITWDIRNTGTYIMRFVTTPSSTTPILTLGTLYVTSPGTIALDIQPSLLLFANQTVYLQLYRNEGAIGWWDRNSSSYSGQYLTIGPNVYYDATSYNYSLPVYFYGQLVEINKGVIRTLT